METIQNAKIKFSFLGVDEDGILLFQVGFECKSGTCYYSEKRELVDATFLTNILNVLELRSWEELPRKFARIKIDNDTKKVIAIGNLIEEKWVRV